MPTRELSLRARQGAVDDAPQTGWPRALLGGAIGAVVSVAIVLTLGVVAMSPLGAQAAAFGVPAAFVTVIVSAALFAAGSRSLIPTGGPSSATALIVAAMVARLLLEDSAAGQDFSALRIVVAVAAAVMLMGLFQIAMAACGLARLARFVPQPVLAGFMTGLAVLIMLVQLPPLLALSPEIWREQGLRALAAAQPGALALGVGTAALIWMLAWRAPRAPAALLGLLAGVAAFQLARWALPGVALGPTLGALDAPLTLPGLLSLWRQPAAGLGALWQHAPTIALTGGLLALIGTLESMLAFRATDQQFGTRHDQVRDLLAMGLANLAGGLVGALPMVQLRARTLAILQAGGSGRAAAYGAVAASALLIAASGDAIAQLPQAVLAGVMLTVAVSLVDRWSLQLLRRRGAGGPAVRTSLLIVALVCTLTVWQGAAAGVMAGMLVATVVFVRGMNRSLLRARCDAVAQPSRRVYAPAVEQWLQTARRRVIILELEGALFFGSAERLSDEADLLPAETRFLVLDLRRVSAIDDSGAMVLNQLQARLARRGISLLLAGLGPASVQRRQLQPFLDDDGAKGAGNWFDDCDHAVESAERRLVDAHPDRVNAVGGTVPLAQSTLMVGLTAANLAHLARHLQPQRLQAGQHLFEEGDAGDGVYVLTQGSVSLVSANGQRYASFSPATIFGELAMLDGQGRSAHAVADIDSEVFLLTREALATLADTDPLLCSQLYRNMAVHLAGRLRVASLAWRSAAA